MQKPALIVIGATLLTLVSGSALADPPEASTSKRTNKILRTLDSMGISDPAVKALVNDVDGRIKDKYLSLGEEKIAGGTLTLHYELKGGVGAEQMELKYQPDDSNVSLTARPKAVMLNYGFDF